MSLDWSRLTHWPTLPHPTPHISSFALFNDPQPRRLLALQAGVEGGRARGQQGEAESERWMSQNVKKAR